jgi:predicted deacetylase
MYLIRLDDASEYMDVEKWNRLEGLLDRYDIKPIVGIIPNNQDVALVSIYQKDFGFWDKVYIWNSKGWTIALHGYLHVYSSNSGGINPVNFQSEFAGLSLDKQREKIRYGIQLFQTHEIKSPIFFAPSHTFDMNTLEALKRESDIRIISDTIANDIYKKNDFYFIPQQSGHVQKLPFKLTTFCYHPNAMNEIDFVILESFLKKNREKFISFTDLTFKDRKLDLYDKALRKLYFFIRAVRSKLRGR